MNQVFINEWNQMNQMNQMEMKWMNELLKGKLFFDCERWRNELNKWIRMWNKLKSF